MSDDTQPLNPDAMRLAPVSGGLASYPPVEKWHDWVEYDTAQWPRKVEKHYQIIPTICFNCEAACGLLGFVDKDSESIAGLCGCARTHLASVGLWFALEKSLETKSDGKEFSVSRLVSMDSKA